MKDYYETKIRRYEFILDAVDKKISNELRDENLYQLKGTIFFPKFKKKVEELAEIREMITSELDFCWNQIRRFEEEENANKKAAEQAAETEAE